MVNTKENSILEIPIGTWRSTAAVAAMLSCNTILTTRANVDVRDGNLVLTARRRDYEERVSLRGALTRLEKWALHTV